MPNALFVVHGNRPHWWVRFERRDFGPYPSYQDAVRAAIVAADRAGQRGFDAQVRAEDEVGITRVEWTFGFDPPPEQGSIQPDLLNEADREVGSA